MDPAAVSDAVIRLTRSNGLSGAQEIRTRAAHTFGDDAPISVAFRDKRIVSGCWGMHPDNGDGDRTLAGTIAILYAMDKEKMEQLAATSATTAATTIHATAHRTLRSLVNDAEVQAALKEAQENASTSPTAARVASLYRCALQAMNPTHGNALDALIYLTELYSTLATLAELKRATLEQQEGNKDDEASGDGSNKVKSCPA
jgi:hypothetical protein